MVRIAPRRLRVRQVVGRAACAAWTAGALASTDAWADPAERERTHADAAIAADLGSTLAGLAAGLHEMNPLGAAIVPLKLVMRERIAAMPDEMERREAYASFATAQYAAAASNVCTLVFGSLPVSIACFVGTAIAARANLRPAREPEAFMVASYGRLYGSGVAACVRSHVGGLQRAAAAHRQYVVSLSDCQAHEIPAGG